MKMMSVISLNCNRNGKQIKTTLIASQQKCRSYENKIDSLILFTKQMKDILSLIQDMHAEFLKVRIH